MEADPLMRASEFLKTDPYRALALFDDFIAANPLDPSGYYFRHDAWLRFGQYRNALSDCNRAIELKPSSANFQTRGAVYRYLGEFDAALRDFDRARALDYDGWLTSFGPHERADTLARLGRLNEALADCELIDEDHWMPAHFGLPGGNKAQFIAEIRRRALDALTGGKTTPPVRFAAKQFPPPPGRTE